MLFIIIILLSYLSHVDSTHYCILSIPLLGHLLPLLNIAEELVGKNNSITIVTVDENREDVKLYIESMESVKYNGLKNNIKLVNIGDLNKIESLNSNPIYINNTESVFLYASSVSSFQESSLIIVDWLFTIWRPMYDSLILHLTELNKSNKIDCIIADLMTYAAYDISIYFNIPIVYNNADELNVLSADILPYDDSIPGLFVQKSIHLHGILERIIYPFFRILGRVIVTSTLNIKFNSYRKTRDLEPLDLMTYGSKHLIITNSLLGLEYSRALPPLLQMVGVCLPSIIPKLEDKWDNWMNNNYNIFINMGTLVRLDQNAVNSIMKSIENIDTSLILNSTRTIKKIKVLWKLHKDTTKYLSNIPINEDYEINNGVILHISSWFPSQLSILASEHLKLFVSHCGINSLHEALYFAKPVICIPFFADQGDMALRLVDAKAGFSVSKSGIFPALSNAINSVPVSNIQKQIDSLSALFKLAGGSKRAALLIEKVANYGIDEWQLKSDYAHWTQRNGWDVTLFYLILFWLLSFVPSCCKRFLCCFKTSRKIEKLKVL